MIEVPTELLRRMVEHLEDCSDTWTPTDPLLADLYAALGEADASAEFMAPPDGST